MGEQEERLKLTSDTDILRSFRDALVAVYPILRRLHCLEDDTQPYDDFDRVANTLWEVVVLGTFQWREGLAAAPTLPAYGFTGLLVGPAGYIQVSAPGFPAFRFIQFIGDRAFGTEPFNAIEGVDPEGKAVICRFGPQVCFQWIR